MYKELMDDVEGFTLPDHGYLAGWAVQGQHFTSITITTHHTPHTTTHHYHMRDMCCNVAGVLLLNSCLTVREREANSHEGKVCVCACVCFQYCVCVCVCVLGMGEAD